jgi:hypothetical protein
LAKKEDESEGFLEGGIGGGEIVDGEIEEGGCEETFLCLSLTFLTPKLSLAALGTI